MFSGGIEETNGMIWFNEKFWYFFLAALKEVIKRLDLKNFCLIIYGTPAEEAGNGKIKMIQHCVFDEADICMMSHPFLLEIPEPEGSALVEMKFRFEGENALWGV